MSQDTEHDPKGVVEEIFQRMAEPDERATTSELYADDVTITCPGGQFSGPTANEELLEFLRPLYDWAKKDIDRWIVENNRIVVDGTLYGVDTDGQAFEGVRFVDVYEIEEGQVTRLDFWNDLDSDGVIELTE